MTATDTVTRLPATHRFRRLVGAGLVATLVATVAAGLVAAVARAAGVDFVVDGGETIPVSGVAFQAGVFSLVGLHLVLAAVMVPVLARSLRQVSDPA
ncbi:DUF6069 family protein [Nocardioides astragali]|uniref:DUF6069 family protein n=1 Tax=Nocardioides astragali TaxID=1776736 RepID=A0ABW2N085_9ACTN|nr:DUF6069 family protein [Nocardioides astragali]